VWQLGLADGGMGFALIPHELGRGHYAGLFTYMFLHGGVAHLLGNLYFLYTFGDNVEERLGRARFLGLYLVSGVVAALLHGLVKLGDATPVVGASGAISGVMAAYAVLFPRTRLISLILVFRVRWNTRVYLGMWLLLQVIGAAFGMQGVAWWAHIGGFLIGWLLAYRLRPAKLGARA
jgi:membrane associated rhomboid family serine protease